MTQNKSKDELNRLYPEDLPIHEWYRFVLSFPPHLVRDYLQRFKITTEHCVLDPFCGTGTTVVEAKKQGIFGIGIEANPVVQYAARVKTDWDVDPGKLEDHSKKIAKEASERLAHVPLLDVDAPSIEDAVELKALSPDQEKLIITNSISPRPLHRVLTLLEVMEEYRDERFYDYQRVALAKRLIYGISNLRFGPEVGVSRTKKIDSPVVDLWASSIESMVNDLKTVQDRKCVKSKIYHTDARSIADVFDSPPIDAVITSPPYPNEKDYSRTTRLESVLLGFMNSKADLRQHKEGLLVSNTRNAYVKDTTDKWVENNAKVQELAHSIEKKRIDFGKTSGFEKLYHRVVKLYFGGMAKHLEELKPKLRPGARLAYVVGDQASYFRIMIRTGELIAEIAKELGYEVEGIDLFRTRPSTVTKEQLREEVVLLRWPG